MEPFPGLTTSYVAQCCQRITSAIVFTAVQIAPSLRAASPRQSSPHQRTSTVPWWSNRQREPRSNSWFLTPSVLCVRPKYVWTSHQSEAILVLFPARSGLRNTHERSVSYLAPCCRNLPLQQPSMALPNHTIVGQPFSRVLAATNTTYTSLPHFQDHDSFTTMHHNLTTEPQAVKVYR